MAWGLSGARGSPGFTGPRPSCVRSHGAENHVWDDGGSSRKSVTPSDSGVFASDSAVWTSSVRNRGGGFLSPSVCQIPTEIPYTFSRTGQYEMSQPMSQKPPSQTQTGRHRTGQPHANARGGRTGHPAGAPGRWPLTRAERPARRADVHGLASRPPAQCPPRPDRWPQPDVLVRHWRECFSFSVSQNIGVGASRRLALGSFTALGRPGKRQ